MKAIKRNMSELDELQDKFQNGHISRREFLRLATLGGISFGAAQLLAACAPVTPAPTAQVASPSAPSPVPTNPLATAVPQAVATQAPTSVGTGTAVLAVGQAPESWDPAIASRSYEVQVDYSIYDAPFRYVNLQRVNRLCDQFSYSPTGDTFFMTIKKGVKFHDGSEMKASDVVYSMKRIMQLNGPTSLLWKDIVKPEQVKVVDDYSLSISLPKPYGALPDTLAWVYVVSEKQVTAKVVGNDSGQGWLKNADAGSGAYMIKSFQPGERLSLARFPDYWAGWGPKYLDGYVNEIIREPATIRLAMQNGQAQLTTLTSLDVDSLEQIRSSGSSDLFEFAGPTEVAIKMNCQKFPTSNKSFRKAMCYAFDYDAVVKGLMKGRTDYMFGAYPKGFRYFKSFENTDKLYRRNLDKARSLLKDSGFDPNSQVLKYNYRVEDPTQQNYGLILQASLKEIGVNVQLEGVTGPEFADRQKNPQNAVHFNRISSRALMLDPDFFLLESFYSPTWQNDKGYFATMCFYKNPQVDQLIESARFSVDETARTKMYSDLQDIVYDDAPSIWVEQQHYIVAASKKIKGYVPNPFGAKEIDFASMYLEG